MRQRRIVSEGDFLLHSLEHVDGVLSLTRVLQRLRELPERLGRSRCVEVQPSFATRRVPITADVPSYMNPCSLRCPGFGQELLLSSNARQRAYLKSTPPSDSNGSTIPFDLVARSKIIPPTTTRSAFNAVCPGDTNFAPVKSKSLLTVAPIRLMGPSASNRETCPPPPSSWKTSARKNAYPPTLIPSAKTASATAFVMCAPWRSRSWAIRARRSRIPPSEQNP